MQIKRSVQITRDYECTCIIYIIAVYIYIQHFVLENVLKLMLTLKFVLY